MDLLHEHMKHGCCAEVEKLREENTRLEAEVARLEGLILDWFNAEMPNYTPVESLNREARRIRAQREGK